MKVSTTTKLLYNSTARPHKHPTKGSIYKWISKRSDTWNYNRLGITAVGIFFNVTFAAAMISLAGISAASPFAFGTGILFAFIANALALGQAHINWVLGSLALSYLVNISLAIIFATMI